MIPVRVMVRGFLSYKDQTELTFDSAKLWMLSGRNGAGKSAIFDAITFALFGAGRFDNPVVKEYIHHDSKDMDIEFDFDLDDKRYRVKRTASRRAASTYQAYTLDRQNNLTPPLPIPGTETNRPFETWVERTLNMNCNTFVASAMLRQGDSDRLLSSRDTDRALIMSRIVDISAYEKLHGFVNEQAKDFENEKFRLQTALTQLETDIKVDAKKAINRFGWPEDNYLLQQDLIVSAKRLMIQLAEKEKEASVEAQRLQILLDAMNRIQATLTGWKQKVVQRTELSIQKAAYRGILERLPEIERRAARLQELAATIPTRQLWNTARITWRTAKTCHTNTLAEIERLDKVLTQLEAQLTPAENRLSEAKIKMTNATEALGKYRAELKVLQNRQGNLLNIEGNAMCNICGKELTEEQRQEQIDIVAEAIEAATEKVKVAIGAKDATGKSVEDTEREVKRLSVELRSTADKIKDAEKAYALAAQTMLTSEANATRILQDAGRFYQTCAAFIVNEKPYMPEDICAMLLNDLVLIKALEMGTYPTEENTQAAQKELQSLKGADADKRELDQAKQDAGDLDTQIGTYVSLQQVDEIQIAEDTNGLSEDFRSALIQAMASTNKSIEEHLSVVVAIDANTNQAERHLRETEAKKRVDASTSKPGEWVMKQIELNSTARSKSQ